MTKDFTILAVDTSGSRCDIAITRNSSVLARKTGLERNAHSERILNLIDGALQCAGITREELNAVAVSIGPGSFTGLRVGLSTAKGLAMALRIPILGVPTHHAIASMLGSKTLLWVTNTARKHFFYWTPFAAGIPTQECAILSAASLIRQIEQPVTIATDKPEWIRAELSPEVEANVTLLDEQHAYADAGIIGIMANARLRRGEHDNLETLTPSYVQSFQGVM